MLLTITRFCRPNSHTVASAIAGSVFHAAKISKYRAQRVNKNSQYIRHDVGLNARFANISCYNVKCNVKVVEEFYSEINVIVHNLLVISVNFIHRGV